MDAPPRLKPEYNNVAALRRLVKRINDGPDSDGLSEEQVEEVVQALLRTFGLSVEKATLGPTDIEQSPASLQT